MPAKCKEQPLINNHFSHNLATTTATATTNKIISSNNAGLTRDFNNQQLQPFYNNKTNKTKRLSVLSTTMPKQYTLQQQQHYQANNKQLQQQQQQPYYLTQQHCQQAVILRRSPKPLYSLTLNNKYAFATTAAATTATAPNPPSQPTPANTTTSSTTTRNSLSSKDLNIFEFSHLKDCDLDHNDDYYLPSSMEILGIQKSLQRDDNDVATNLHINAINKDNIVVNDHVDDDNNEEDNVMDVAEDSDENELVVELDNKRVKRLSANLNDLEVTKNATNNLLKQQHQQQQTNRLWYH